MIHRAADEHPGSVPEHRRGALAQPLSLVYAERETGPLHMDLYRPAGERLAPVVLFMHGGGWFTGDRTLAPDLRRYFADRGIAMASIDYRLSHHAIFPAQLHDVRSAVRYLRSRAGELGLDGGNIGLWGASAGGHLAAIAGLTGGQPSLAGEPVTDDSHIAVRVQVVVESYGPTDLLDENVPPGAGLPGMPPEESPTARLLGGLPELHLDRARAASPLSHITPDAPPFQISHGTSDQLVPHPHSELLHAALVNAGAYSELYLVHDFRHGFLNPPSRGDVNTDTVLDSGRLDAAGLTTATYRTAPDASAESDTTFGFDTIGDFLVRHLIEGAS